MIQIFLCLKPSLDISLQFTWCLANDPSIFAVSAVVLLETIVRAVKERPLLSATGQVVQLDGPHTLAEFSLCRGTLCGPIAQPSAHHRCLVHIPAVIAHGTPLTVKEDFNTPFCARPTTTQTNCSWTRQGSFKVGKNRVKFWKHHKILHLSSGMG